MPTIAFSLIVNVECYIYSEKPEQFDIFYVVILFNKISCGLRSKDIDYYWSVAWSQIPTL